MSIVDWDAVRRNIPGGPEGIRTIAAMLRVDGLRDLEAIRQGLAAGSATDVDLAAHRLKSAAHYFAAHEAVAAADLVEKRARDGDLAGAADALPELEAQLNRLLDALSAEGLG